MWLRRDKIVGWSSYSLPKSPVTVIPLPNSAGVPIGEYLEAFAAKATAYSKVFSYHADGIPMGEEENKEFLEEPIAALPPDLLGILPPILLTFVPYLESPSATQLRASRRAHKPAPNPVATATAEALVANAAPPKGKELALVYLPAGTLRKQAVLVFGVKDVDMSDYHYHFFRGIAQASFERLPEEIFAGYSALVREELKSRVHGEVDEPSWNAKQELLRRQTGIRGETKLFREYAKESFFDTLTLFLHGLCCDIDVEPGPRQIASRYLRKRLQYLQGCFAPPEGFALFPEDSKK